MAKKVLVALDMQRNEIQNAVVQNLAGTTPATPVEGQIYNDSTAHKAYIYENGAFVEITAQGTANAVTRASAAGASGEIILSAGADRSAASYSGSAGIVKISASGVVSIAAAGTDFVAATSGTAIQKANGSGGLTAATTDVDFATPAYVDARVYDALTYRPPVDLAFNDAGNSLPLVTSTQIDGVTVTNNMRVLVLDSATAGEDKKIYKATVVATDITWAVQQDGSGADLPKDGATTWINGGTIYADLRYSYTGSTWIQTSGSGSIPDASTTVKGKVELATQAESQARTDTVRACTPASLADFPRKFTATFNNTSDWAGAGPYTVTIAAATHGLGAITTLTVSVSELNGSDYDVVDTDIKVLSTGNVVITASAKFTGQYVIIG